MDKIEAMKRQIMGLGAPSVSPRSPPASVSRPQPTAAAIIAKLKAMLEAERKARMEAEARLKRVLEDIAKRPVQKPRPRLTIVKPVEPSAEIEIEEEINSEEDAS